MNLNAIERDPRIMITLSCNFKCSFCSTPQPEKQIPEISATEWLSFFNRMKFVQVRFSGGEPLLHPGFKTIMQYMKTPYQIYTNLKLWTYEHLKIAASSKVKKLYISYHTQYQDVDEFIEKVVEIDDRGINYDVHFVAVNGQREEKIIEFDRKMMEAGLEYFGAPNQRAIKNNRNPGPCHINRSLYGPDGKRYPCMTYLREKGLAIPSEKHYTGIICNRQDCLPCDVDVMTKEKTK